MCCSPPQRREGESPVSTPHPPTSHPAKQAPSGSPRSPLASWGESRGPGRGEESQSLADPDRLSCLARPLA